MRNISLVRIVTFDEPTLPPVLSINQSILTIKNLYDFISERIALNVWQKLHTVRE